MRGSNPRSPRRRRRLRAVRWGATLAGSSWCALCLAGRGGTALHVQLGKTLRRTLRAGRGGLDRAASTSAVASVLSLAVLTFPTASNAEMGPAAPFPTAPTSQPQEQRWQLLQQEQKQPVPLSQSGVFKALRVEPPVSRALRELNELKDLQDDRLSVCADRGIYWEQCFMFGEPRDLKGGATAGGGTVASKTSSNPSNGLDYQLISPMGAFNPGSDNAATQGEQERSDTQPIPTW